jgi:hypothetical protein
MVLLLLMYPTEKKYTKEQQQQKHTALFGVQTNTRHAAHKAAYRSTAPVVLVL